MIDLSDCDCVQTHPTDMLLVQLLSKGDGAEKVSAVGEGPRGVGGVVA